MIKKLFTDEKVNISMVAVCFSLYMAMFLLVTLFKTGDPAMIMGSGRDFFVQWEQGSRPLEEMGGYLFSHSDIRTRFMWQFEETDLNSVVFVNQVPNILITLAIGICLPLLQKKDNLFRDTMIGLFISMLVETIQLFSKVGGFELIDMLCNTVGTFLGALFTFCMRKWLKETTFNKTVNICAFTISIVEVPIVLYMLVNTIINFNYYLLRVM